MNERTLILSDLHLGRPRGGARSADALRPLWADVDHLVLNGDAAEVHHPEYRSEAADQLMRLTDLCRWDGVTLTLISGNHDAMLTDRRCLALAGGAVLVTHGDALLKSIAPWSRRAQRMARTHELAWERLEDEPITPLQRRLRAAQHAGFAEWSDFAHREPRRPLLDLLARPWAAWRVLRCWATYGTTAAAFAEVYAPEARLLVLGHIHRPGVWHRNGRTIVNTGSFGLPHTPRAVVLDHGELTVRKVIRRGEAYRLSDPTLARFTLPSGSATSDDSGAAAPDALRPPHPAGTA